MLCNQDCYDMMFLWDSLLLRSEGFGNIACLSALLLIGSHSALVNICMSISVYVCMCLPGLVMPRTAAGYLIMAIITKRVEDKYLTNAERQWTERIREIY